jgi:hypothetical protein
LISNPWVPFFRTGLPGMNFWCNSSKVLKEVKGHGTYNGGIRKIRDPAVIPRTEIVGS